MSAKTRLPSGTCAIPIAASACGLILERSFPSKIICPLRMGIRPEIVCSVVVLPAPFAPISATVSPSSTRKEMLFKARMTP